MCYFALLAAILVVCGAYIHTYVVKRGKSVIAIVAFTTALLVRTTALASDDATYVQFFFSSQQLQFGTPYILSLFSLLTCGSKS
jgi:hypothetical protein